MANNLGDVVDAALRVLGSYGLEFLSMRRVAAELEVQPSALYHHVANKQSLLALMADRIVEGLTVSPGGDWTKELLVGCHALRTAMLSVRDGAEVVATASAFRLGASSVESSIASAIASAGVDDRVARDAGRAILLYTFGHTQATQMHTQASSLGAITADPEIFSDDSFDAGLRIILSGLGAQPM